ncbi:acyl--CoA ligase [Mycobacterium frederiksbergense]|uniref:Long-chain fatty acid--CoA ligase n=1 Tax=Mycolicibacterium frederiksbergense TaxID=117567 RepID=A0A6H0S1W8_9MYCO|nr:class I adenylate-forming enzyme family protein [Mycolicibacterium frederiksbergense]MCV7046645.1 acyl--CoA ligase [Mycolicibacterium frederiksbergense]QIV80315.1 long-chain fatty acid--CoA ligase [Mycolicibacterium frederiksbergense]
MTDTIDDLIRARADESKPMVIDPGTRISYAELASSTASLASGLLDAGIGKGTRVGLIMPNSADWVRIALAVTRIGAVLVPLSTLLTAPELTEQLRTASVQHLIAVEEFRGRRYAPGPVASLRRTWTPGEVLTLRGTRPFPPVRPADPLIIMFTSGSSGPPKGVRHSHGGALAAVRSGLAARLITEDTRLYLPMPFFWVGGFGAGILSALLAGATLVTEPIPQPASTLELLRRERVTLFRGWPEQAAALARCLSEPLPDLAVGSLDALLPAERRSAPGARASLFGMTESFGPYSGYPADTDMPESAWGSCGKPFAGMDVRITDIETGERLPAGEVGQIQIRGPHVLRGICRRSREEVFTPDGYYPTGDLGLLDEDGFLFYRGRSDDMFKVSGATVYPSEVERALRAIPGVRAAFVVDLAGRVAAAVVTSLTVDELRAAARERLSAFKVPVDWLVLDSSDAVPFGATGKADKKRIRDMIAGSQQ